MNILSICDNPDVLQVMRIINIVITIIKIAVPILLIIFIMIELIGAVADEEKFKKVTSGAVKKFIAALLIFLIPTFVQVIVVNVVGSNETNEEYKNCLKDLSVEQINKIYEKNALEAIVKAESTNNYSDYSNAVLLTHKIPDKEVRTEYLNRLSAVKAKIDLINENNKKNNSSNIKPNGSTIYMGDSRTNGMKSVGLDSNEQVIAKDGGNYEDFLNHMVEAKNKLSGNKTYNVVLNYGVNDLGNVDKYCSKYKEFISSVDKGNTFYIVSVNPVRRNSNQTGATNSSIETFNKKIESCISGITNAKYCDVYSSANLDTWEKSYIKSDDIHYTPEGYKYIYSKIKECIG